MPSPTLPAKLPLALTMLPWLLLNVWTRIRRTEWRRLMANESPASSTPLKKTPAQGDSHDPSHSIGLGFSTRPGQVDYLERISRVAVLCFFVIAVIAILVAPLLALAWQQ